MGARYLAYAEIDKHKWDQRINAVDNGLIYAKSFYLDAMAENWDAIVLNDYEVVMPLTWRKKWGVRYLYQPAFIQQGGMFFSGELSDEMQNEFLNIAFSHFPFAEITLNYKNSSPAAPVICGSRNNLVLSLNASYNVLFSSFDSIAVKNLKRANNAALSYQAGYDFVTSLSLYEQLYGRRLPSFSRIDYTHFGEVCNTLLRENSLLVRNVLSSAGELLATAILLMDSNRIYNVISCVTAAGKIAQANYSLYDGLIKEFANSQYLLDFEGSDVPGIAAFYKRFGAQPETYPFIKLNNLPPLLKLFKP